MDHEAICDCPFLARCASFGDPLISEDRKGPRGMGCTGQSDLYRSRHCRSFGCQYLSMVISDAMKQPPPNAADQG
jgi:hypothetical protein